MPRFEQARERREVAAPIAAVSDPLSGAARAAQLADREADRIAYVTDPLVRMAGGLAGEARKVEAQRDAGDEQLVRDESGRLQVPDNFGTPWTAYGTALREARMARYGTEIARDAERSLVDLRRDHPDPEAFRRAAETYREATAAALPPEIRSLASTAIGRVAGQHYGSMVVREAERAREDALVGATGLLRDLSTNRTRAVVGAAGTRADAPAVEAGDPARQAYAYLRQQGWEEHQAAAIVARIQHESGFRTVAEGDRSHPRGSSFGLMQWRESRVDDFVAFVGKHPREANATEHLAFLHHELTEGKERAAGEALRGSRTAREAGDVVVRRYARPANADGESARTGELAEGLLPSLTGRRALAAEGDRTETAIRAHIAGMQEAGLIGPGRARELEREHLVVRPQQAQFRARLAALPAQEALAYVETFRSGEAPEAGGLSDAERQTISGVEDNAVRARIALETHARTTRDREHHTEMSRLLIEAAGMDAAVRRGETPTAEDLVRRDRLSARIEELSIALGSQAAIGSEDRRTAAGNAAEAEAGQTTDARDVIARSVAVVTEAARSDPAVAARMETLTRITEHEPPAVQARIWAREAQGVEERGRVAAQAARRLGRLTLAQTGGPRVENDAENQAIVESIASQSGIADLRDERAIGFFTGYARAGVLPHRIGHMMRDAVGSGDPAQMRAAAALHDALMADGAARRTYGAVLDDKDRAGFDGLTAALQNLGVPNPDRPEEVRQHQERVREIAADVRLAMAGKRTTAEEVQASLPGLDADDKAVDPIHATPQQRNRYLARLATTALGEVTPGWLGTLFGASAAPDWIPPDMRDQLVATTLTLARSYRTPEAAARAAAESITRHGWAISELGRPPGARHAGTHWMRGAPETFAAPHGRSGEPSTTWIRLHVRDQLQQHGFNEALARGVDLGSNAWLVPAGPPGQFEVWHAPGNSPGGAVGRVVNGVRTAAPLTVDLGAEQRKVAEAWGRANAARHQLGRDTEQTGQQFREQHPVLDAIGRGLMQ